MTLLYRYSLQVQLPQWVRELPSNLGMYTQIDIWIDNITVLTFWCYIDVLHYLLN